MMHDYSTGGHKKNAYNSQTGLFEHNEFRDEAYYRRVRSRFLQQSARYLGADLSDNLVQSLCFDGCITGQPFIKP